MTVKRMDHVGIVVDDLDAAIAFFTELGLEAENRMQLDGAWVDRVVGLDGVNVEVAMMRTPDGNSKLELTKFMAPSVLSGEPYPAPANTLGLRRIMFAVDDIRDVVRRLKKHGGELVGEIAQYESVCLLCYVRGPSGIIVALTESLR
jgi:catechol 2,3-dioxygenase-like lactoylglutathione lyase family enzyme